MALPDPDMQSSESTGLSVSSVLEEARNGLREVTLMIEQSQGEVGKLSQRNAAITAHLQQVQTKGDASAEDLKMAYDSALDAQQRLFVMRGQLDKLQGDKVHYEQQIKLLEQVAGFIESSGKPSAGSVPKAGGSSIEMVIQAQESERQRLSRQMHDGPAQALSNFILQAEIAARLLEVDQEQAKNELTNLKAAALSTLQKVRNFISELRPMMLDDLGLIPTLKRYADTFKEQTGLEVSVSVSGQERRMESFVEVMVFRAIQELLGNASRHSQASLVKVSLDVNDNSVKVTVDDNGKGFDTEILSQGNSLGINLIRDRVQQLGGTCEVDSVVGRGTRITFALPAGKVA